MNAISPPISKAELIERLAEIDGDELHDALSRIITAKAKEEITNCCPSCGYNLRNDLMIERDKYVIDPRGAVTYRRIPVALTPTMISIMHTLAKANGRTVPSDAIMNRCTDTDRLNPSSNLKAHVQYLRNRLKEAGLPNPIQTKRGQGYYWAVDKKEQ